MNYKVVVAFALGCVVFSTFGKVVYLSPTGAGEKDGTSWENALAFDNNNCASAYAAAVAGATAEEPVEIWMKEGWYLLPDGKIILQPHVRLRGGFRGDETSASEADPETRWTIISVSHYALLADKYYWLDSSEANAGPIWTYYGGTYTYHPIPEGAYLRGRETGNYNLFVDEGGSCDDNEISGIVFTACSRSCFHLTSTSEGSIKISKCRFLANSGYAGILCGSVFSSGGASVTVQDCYFEGCNSAIFFNSQSEVTCIVSNCSFVSCFAKQNSAGVQASGSSRVAIVDCSFERNWLNNNQASIDIYANTTSKMRVEGCSFKSSRGFERINGHGCIKVCSNVDIDIARCVFADASTGSDKDIYAGGACIADNSNSTGASIKVSDSYFEGNSFLATDGSGAVNYTRALGCIYGMQNGNYHAFVNCTFVSNRIVSAMTQSSSAPHVSLITGGYSANKIVVANCLFKDNDCLKVTTDGATTNRIAELDLGGNGNSTRAVINTIFVHHATDYTPFSGDTRRAMNIASLCIPGYDYSSSPYSGYFAKEPLLSVDPCLEDCPLMKSGVMAWGLKYESPVQCRKGGVPIWEGTDRFFYIYDSAGNAEQPWFNLSQQTRLTDEAAESVGVSLGVKPLPDAFGVERVLGEIAMGPMNVPKKFGFLIFVR